MQHVSFVIDLLYVESTLCSHSAFKGRLYLVFFSDAREDGVRLDLMSSSFVLFHRFHDNGKQDIRRQVKTFHALTYLLVMLLLLL
jgi:hypothetical protein